MSGLNLSGWALNHRSFVIYCMIAVTVAGLTSYFRLGRSEDPNFTFRTMVVQAAWPGATLDDTLQQVTERIERKLQETKGLDFLRSYTSAGVTTIFVNLKGETTAAHPIYGIRFARTSAIFATRCRRVSSARGLMTTSATLMGSSTVSPPTNSAIASCATMSRQFARGC
jgi:AcrB/AcrD/AcrF family protein